MTETDLVAPSDEPQSGVQEAKAGVAEEGPNLEARATDKVPKEDSEAEVYASPAQWHNLKKCLDQDKPGQSGANALGQGQQLQQLAQQNDDNTVLLSARQAELQDAWFFHNLEDEKTFLGFAVYAHRPQNDNPNHFKVGDTVIRSRPTTTAVTDDDGSRWTLQAGEIATVVGVRRNGADQSIRLRNQAAQETFGWFNAEFFVVAKNRPKADRPPELELVLDYLTQDTFIEGISKDYSDASSDDENARLPSMTSTTRSRINGWLPLYINEKHWAHARGIAFAQNFFARLATGRENANFRVEHALDVCCRLLLSAVKGFTVGQRADRPTSTCKYISDLKASDRAVQMYADVHRLFLQIAHDIPGVRTLAQARLRDFIDHPRHRTNRNTRDLGLLIQYLLITDDITWDDLAPTFVPEALRRHVARGAQAWWSARDAQSWRSSDDPAFAFHPCRSVEEIIDAFDKFAPSACQVTYFCVLFYKKVGRPDGQTLKDVEAAYDRRWGGLAQERKDEIVAMCAKLCENKSVRDIIPHMVPGKCTDDDLADFILWAEEYGWGYRNDIIPAHQWPEKGKNVLLQAWRQDWEYRLHRATAAGEAARAYISGEITTLPGTPPLTGYYNSRRVFVIARPAAHIPAHFVGYRRGNFQQIAGYVRRRLTNTLDNNSVFHGFCTIHEAAAYYRGVTGLDLPSNELAARPSQQQLQ